MLKGVRRIDSNVDTVAGYVTVFQVLEEKYLRCMEEVEEHKKKAKEMKDKALRALADMENARMRHQKEVSRSQPKTSPRHVSFSSAFLRCRTKDSSTTSS